MRTASGAGLGALAAIGSFGALVERHRLVLTRADVPVAGLPPPLDGLRVGLMSDLHHGPLVSQAHIAGAVARLMAAGPDLIVLGGDYVTRMDLDHVGPCAEALAPLSAPLGVFAVLGNHDPERAVASAFEARGFRLLRDARVELPAGGEPIALGGLRYWSKKEADVERLFRGARGFPILVAHDPRRLRQAAARGVPLVLAGHTHGGQVAIPFLGAPAALGYPVVAGLGRAASTAIFVTRGVGTIYLPVRINCPPEVALLTLRRRSA